MSFDWDENRIINNNTTSQEEREDTFFYCRFHQQLKIKTVSRTNKLDVLMFTVPRKTRSLNKPNISGNQPSRRQKNTEG